MSADEGPSADDYEMHDLLSKRAVSLVRGSDDDDPEQRNVSSAERYIQDLKWFDSWLDEQGLEPDELTKLEAEELGHSISNTFNGTTARNRWRTIYKTYQYLVRVDIMDTNPLAPWDPVTREEFGMTTSPQQEKELEDGEKYAVTQEDIRVMEKHAGERFRLRNACIIRCMWQTGVRAGELVGIELDHLNREERLIELPGSITKNGKPRTVPYQNTLADLLRKWIDDGYRDRFSSSIDSSYLFVSHRSPQMSTDAVEDIVIDAAREAGINRVLYEDAQEGQRWKITPHNIRHGYGSYLVHETDATLYEASVLLGHASTAVTQQVYLEDDPDAGVEAGRRYGPE